MASAPAALPPTPDRSAAIPPEGLGLLFPGQGSQQVGMGYDLADCYEEARRVYAQADATLGFSLSELCFHGPKEELDNTANTQPALFVTCIAVLRVLEGRGALPAPQMVAGHSLGELTALVAAGALDWRDGLFLVRERGRLMKLAGERNPGGMAAILKMDDEAVEEACHQAHQETGRPVQVANYNSPGQVVISGDNDALARAMQVLRDRGAKRIVPLDVSIAAHSALMAGIVDEFRSAVEATPLKSPAVPIVGNVSARPLSSVAEIREELPAQLTQPVRWSASVQWMAQQGVTRFAEVGPKDVLSKMLRRIDGNAEAVSAGDRASVEALLDASGARAWAGQENSRVREGV